MRDRAKSAPTLLVSILIVVFGVGAAAQFGLPVPPPPSTPTAGKLDPILAGIPSEAAGRSRVVIRAANSLSVPLE